MFDDSSYNKPVKLNEEYIYQRLMNHLFCISKPPLNIKTFQNRQTNQFKIIINENRVVSYFYCLDKLIFHKDDGPAIVHVLDHYRYEYYYQNGIPHRIDGPQEIQYRDNDICMFCYKVNNNLHREDGPAYCIYHYEGKNKRKTKQVEQYYYNSLLHRLDGPAHIHYNKIGEIETERWYKDNLLHRLDGPAYITYKDEKATMKLWIVNGKDINKTQLPIFENNQLCGKIKLSKNTIIKAALFDREYGAFLNEKYNNMSR